LFNISTSYKIVLQEIRCRMEAGKFTPCLAYPSELDGKRKKKKPKKSAISDIHKHLEELAKTEDKAAENSDVEQVIIFLLLIFCIFS